MANETDDRIDVLVQLARAQLAQQQRTTGYLAVIAWITMIGFILAVVGTIVAGAYAATH